MIFGYNTNGFAHHLLGDAIDILAEIGYRSVAITVDHAALNPYSPDLPEQLRRTRQQLEHHAMRCTIETGSRFLLDPRRKHWPTLLETAAADRQRRFDFLSRCLSIAHQLGADALSFWSGAKPADVSDTQAMEWLVAACGQLAGEADRLGVLLAFEPEPGMFIETMRQFEALHEHVGHGRFGLTLDVGHVHCLQDGRIEDHIARWHDRLFNVHIEDMRAGVHEHVMPGEGEMDIRGVLRALEAANYGRGLHVELSRHSHDAVRAATRAYAYLRRHSAGESSAAGSGPGSRGSPGAIASGDAPMDNADGSGSIGTPV